MRARQIIVVDFEYASPNPAAIDIANHFHEWCADYHGPAPYALDRARYPPPAARAAFYVAYAAHLPPALAAGAADADALERAVRTWSPASHAMWAVWGVVQAREGVEGGESEFDYLAYAQGRMDLFRAELRELGV